MSYRLFEAREFRAKRRLHDQSIKQKKATFNVALLLSLRFYLYASIFALMHLRSRRLTNDLENLGFDEICT
jgi:hypothetical protein